MNRKIIGIFIVTLLVATVLPVTGSIERNNQANTIETMDNNLAPNPSFEEGSGGMPTGWSYQVRLGEEYTWDSNDAHSGEKSVGITNVNEFPFYDWYTTDLIPVDLVNNLYEISGYCKYSEISNEDQYACIGIELYDENEESLKNTYLTCDRSCIPDEWINLYTLFSGIEEQHITKTKFVRIKLRQRVSSESDPNPNLEIRFDDIYFGIKENIPPNTPSTPTGDTSGKPGEEYTYSTSTTDPEHGNVWYMWSWGDGTSSDWVGPFYSCEICQLSHIWDEKGDYEIMVKAKDFYGAESDWSEPLSISMPKNKPINTPFLSFLADHQHLFPLLRHLLEL